MKDGQNKEHTESTNKNTKLAPLSFGGAGGGLLTARGFTGHEHLDEFGLINMNARIYDPMQGMLLSADNYVQDEANSQNFNRYTYCLNNPLMYTDPTGNQYDGGTWGFPWGKYQVNLSWMSPNRNYIGPYDWDQPWLNTYFSNGGGTYDYVRNSPQNGNNVTANYTGPSARFEYSSGTKTVYKTITDGIVISEQVPYETSGNMYPITPIDISSFNYSTSDNLAIPASLNAPEEYTTSNPVSTIYGLRFKSQQFGSIAGLNRIYFDGRTFAYCGIDYTVGTNGLYYNPVTRSNAYGMTIPVGNGMSNVYISPGALKTPEDLFITMGHEFVHVSNIFWLRSDYDKNVSENAAYIWTFDAAKAMGLEDWKETAKKQLQTYFIPGDDRYFKYVIPLKLKK